MMKGDHRLDVIASQDIDDLLIMCDSLIIPGVRPRLDPAPFDGEAIGIYAQFLQEFEILPENGIVVRYFRDVA
jgi:hypothetical protein